MENNNQGGKFINGFLLGALIGAGAVFLLGTKNGKKILKNLSEDGIGNITDILEQAGELEEDDEEGEPTSAKASAGEMKYPVQAREIPKKPLIRRFFRRSKT